VVAQQQRAKSDFCAAQFLAENWTKRINKQADQSTKYFERNKLTI